MKKFLVLLCLGLAVPGVSAQETNELELLKRQIQEMQENFNRTSREQQQKIDSLSSQLEQLKLKTAVPTAPQVAITDTNITVEPQPGLWTPSDPIRVGRGSAWVDVGLVGTFAAGSSTAGDIEGGTQLGGHDPNQRGFTVQGVEASFSGAVDPYFRGLANVLFSVDSGGESFLELEEAWLETVALPGNLQVRAGQILTDFGRVNNQHPHAWDFVDAPIVNARFLGPDGLRNPGAKVSWLAPTPFFTELSLGIQDSHGETASGFRSSGHSHHAGEEEEGEEIPFGFRHPDNDRGVKGFGDLLFSPRLVTSFDLTGNQVLLVGASAAFGPNSSGGGGDTDTEIYGIDLTWKWTSPRQHSGFPFVKWQTEGMVRRYRVGMFDWDENGSGTVDDGEVENLATPGIPAVLPSETLTDYGLYTQVLYGFRKGWVAGLRFDYVTGDRAGYERMPLAIGGELLGRDPMRSERWRLSPNLTWYPSEFSKLRLQYNYDDRSGVGVDHSVWLQFELVLGAHAAHKF